MSTVQIVGIAVASLVVLIIIVALVMTRRGGASADSGERSASASFLDAAPQDTLSRLGRAEQPMEDVTIDPGAGRASAEAETRAPEPPADGPAVPSRAAPAAGLGLDWGPEVGAPAPGSPPPIEPERLTEHRPPEPVEEPKAPAPGSQPEAASEPAPPAAEPGAVAAPVPDIDTESGAAPAAAQPARPAEGGPAAGDATAPESGSGGRMVPLSDIIVTTSNKMVDLEDPEVRRMLADLVAFEIDQATEFRRQGQTIDAVLQLTEAEKVSRALGMLDSAERIRRMMEETQAQG